MDHNEAPIIFCYLLIICPHNKVFSLNPCYFSISSIFRSSASYQRYLVALLKIPTRTNIMSETSPTQPHHFRQTQHQFIASLRNYHQNL